MPKNLLGRERMPGPTSPGQAPQVVSQTSLASVARRSPGETVRGAIAACEGDDPVARPVEELERRISLPGLSR